jgi:lipopolysaccharide/colanic/teichoic acid biosynthesis glycosyltransferase
VWDEKVGQFGKTFEMPRFRLATRRVPVLLKTGQVRTKLQLSRMGRFLWWSRLSVAPQFINVVCGDMSLSGADPLHSRFERSPRPLPPMRASYEHKPSIFPETDWTSFWKLTT